VLTVWDWLERHGVNHGIGFEPGCGRGDWIAAAPDAVRFDAVDIDPVSVRVAAALTGANVVESRIEEWHLGRSEQARSNGGYDVVVGNVPFSSHKPGVGNPHRDNLHNLAVARSVAMLRPGGVAAVITSRFSLDSADAAWRRRLAAEVDLLAAIRLPSRTHREAGTDVVTDLLILRRPLTGETRPTPDWLDTNRHPLDADTTVTVNRYWAEHPNHVLGRIEPGGAYRRENFTVTSDQPAHAALAAALAGIDPRWAPAGTAPSIDAPEGVASRTATGRALPAGSIVTDPNSATGFSRDGRDHPCAAKNRNQLRLLVTMRDRVLEYLDAPTDAGRTELADLYATYRQLYDRPLNAYDTVEVKAVKRREIDDDDVDEATGERTQARRRYPKLEGFRTDPSWWSVAALEVFDDDTGEAAPAPILQRPILDVADAGWPEHAATIEQAVANSLARWHRIDTAYVAAQLDVDEAAATVQLADVAFETPGGQWQVAAQYLAGDVVGKLDEAVAAATSDGRFQRNVDALRAVQPTPLTAAEITPEFGVTWLEPADIAAFIAEHDGGEITVKYHPPTGVWSFDGWTPGGPAQFRTARYTMAEQVINACNARPVTVHTKVDSGDREVTVVDAEATAAEQLCRDNLTEALQVWCWAQPERATRLAGRYNHLFNRYRAEHWDGSHLTLPGLAADFTPRPHQKDVVWRILASADRGVLMAHGVGAGKTAATIIAAQETKRTGRIAGTALFAVPGNMVEQFARDYLALYPAARVLTPHGATQRDAVREFAGRMATGDFDAAICSHNHLKTIPLSPQLEQEVLARRLADFDAYDPDETLSRAAAKRWARQLEKFTARLEELKDAAEDPAVTYFDRMGVGMLVVDEAHLAKNIDLNTNRQGLPLPTGSQRAEAILARADAVRSQHGAGAIVMATATPVTNSPAEMWVAGRLVAPHALAEAGLGHFDAMAANFLAPVETVEHGADGKLKVVTRLGEYRNFPDLARMFRSFADVRPTSSLGFQVPELVGGKARVHVTEPTAQQQAVAAWCAERAEGRHIARGDAVDPVIAILSTARAAALHPATISDDTATKWATANFPYLRFSWDEPNDKLIEAADTIAEIHHRSRDWTYRDSDRAGAAQVVFCDAGVPTSDGSPSVYSTLTDLLVARGVNRAEIAWVHDIADPARRQPLWDQVRTGHARVLIGSTMQMGVGVNIQTRLYAAHELTAPYRPDWLEQAEGRLVRQGNSHQHVEVHRYVTERSADANSWQILQRKAHFIGQAMSDPEQMTRDLRDESVASVAEEFATIAAIATGDQRHIELAAITATVTRLERADRAHHASAAAQRRQIGELERTIGRLNEQITVIDSLQPSEVDPTHTGQQLLGLRWNEQRSMLLAGVTYDAHRADGLLLEIPGTGIWTRIPNEKLHPDDGGRGLGQRIQNLHDRLPALRAERVESIERAQRQLDAERARPVPEQFPRHAELAEARQRRDQLRAELMPPPPAADQSPAPAAEPLTAADVDEHPVYGQRHPSTAERYAWVAAYERYDPAVVFWGNRARGVDAWAAAVNAYSLNPNNWHATRVHDIGHFHGVHLQARVNSDAIDIEPRHAYAKTAIYPTFSAQPGQLDTAALSTWLRTQRNIATAERNALRHHTQAAHDPNVSAPSYQR
jgi:N12 class adenine-specific DNA methylase